MSLRDHGLAWPPRFAMLWGVALTACLFAIDRAVVSAFAGSPARRSRMAIAIAASIVAQIAVLGVRKRYDFVSRFSLKAFFTPTQLVAFVIPKATLEAYSSRPRFVASALSHAENAFLVCLGRELPHQTPVTATGTLFGRFHQQDLVWPFSVGTAWKPPELLVCDDAGRGPPLLEFGCLKLAHSMSSGSFDKLQVGNLLVRYSSGPKAVVEACAEKATPAPGVDR